MSGSSMFRYMMQVCGFLAVVLASAALLTGQAQAADKVTTYKDENGWKLAEDRAYELRAEIDRRVDLVPLGEIGRGTGIEHRAAAVDDEVDLRRGRLLKGEALGIAALVAAAGPSLATVEQQPAIAAARSEERRVGKECRSRWWRYH